MTDAIPNLINWGVKRLAEAGLENPRSEAELLLAEALSMERHDLWFHPGRPLNQEEALRCRSFIERRSAREPFAYITGRKEFWSLDFKVNPEVIAPRPETECLIECLLAIAREKQGRQDLMILDLGTGSGNIAVTAARELPGTRVIAVDISPGALAMAGENIRRHGLSDRIHLVQSDLFAGLGPGQAGRFDYILSNPPYIKSREIDKLMPEVRDHEPRGALDGGATGLEYYERIISGSRAMLRQGGFLILEIGQDQAGEVAQLIETEGGYESPNVRQDYSGRDRILSAQRRERG